MAAPAIDILSLPSWLAPNVPAEDLAARLTEINNAVDSFPTDTTSETTSDEEAKEVEVVNYLKGLFAGTTPIDSNSDEEIRKFLTNAYRNNPAAGRVLDQITKAANLNSAAGRRFATQAPTASLLRSLTPPPPTAATPTVTLIAAGPFAKSVPPPPGRHHFKLTLKDGRPVLRLYPETTPSVEMVTDGETTLSIGKILFVAKDNGLYFNPNELHNTTRNEMVTRFKTILGDKIKIH